MLFFYFLFFCYKIHKRGDKLLKYYFRFYNLANQEKYYIYDSTKNEIYNTNLNMFDLKFFTSDINIEYNKITNYKLILEREVNGVYIQDSYVEGYQFDGYIKFDKCILNKELINDSNIKYNCYLEFYEGGILVYTSVKNPITILFKSVCDDFNISIKNSIYLGDSYELQDDEVEKINFEIVVESEGNNTLQYYYSFNSEEKIEHKEFSILGTNKKEFEYIVATNIFKNDSTNLHFFLKDSFEKYDALVRGLEDTKTLIEMAEEENDASLLPEIDSEITTFEEHLEELRIETLLSGEYDRSNAILTLHAGAGGTESCDWCQMLMRMYTRWAERKGYTTEVIDYLEGEEAGVKSVTIEISGPDAYGHLKSEHGVHRLVRISPFNAAGKRQTSFVSCDVMPDIDENIDIEINPDDLRIDTYRSSGAGGQHINKTSSAIRITHLPTGIVVQCQNERSQHQNKDKAMQMLKAKLYLLKQQENAEKTSDIRGDVKDINFGNQIRSYVLQPYTMVKDHRTNKDVGNAQSVLDGNIDPFINAYLIWLSTGKKAE